VGELTANDAKQQRHDEQEQNAETLTAGSAK
jgi:hypothetical protein